MTNKISINQFEFGDPKREELAWCAGFFDGEGTIVAVSKGSGRQLCCAVCQSGDHAPSLLQRFKSSVGCGTIYTFNHNKKHPGWKTRYSWRVSKSSDVMKVMAILWHWLGHAKRQQAKKAFETWNSRPPKRPLPSSKAADMANKRWQYASGIHQN